MTKLFDFAGASGARYRYTAIDEARFLPPAGANYVIAEITDEGPNVIFVGETDNLASQAWRADLDRARRRFGGAVALARLNVARAIREAEWRDLVENYRPPLNG